MTKQKQYVFSARTTEEGLRLLNGLRKERGIGWDDLVIDAVCDRYGLDRAVMALPKAEVPRKAQAEAGREEGEGEVQEVSKKDRQGDGKGDRREWQSIEVVSRTGIEPVT